MNANRILTPAEFARLLELFEGQIAGELVGGIPNGESGVPVIAERLCAAYLAAYEQGGDQ